ncbi:MAG: prepilin-type N-terminal cleavage/methylation domain-containing protein [Elusimicrobia bacterium]|nr:prepilin-type N-terminal cleavage/methylation domain-containing protein [Elusimicrobiota bacterium]MBD3411862.1 prepilin-type N-terminal cleavage/methylation domain-containing protein [Elusimicrobiota bacterium]
MHNQKGFSIPELVMVVAVVGIISVPAARYYNEYVRATQEVNARVNFRSDAEQWLFQYQRELQLAKLGTIRIYDGTNNYTDQGIFMEWRYYDLERDCEICVGYKYEPSEHALYRIVTEIDLAPVYIKQKLIDRICNVSSTHPSNPVIFKKLNTDVMIQTVLLSFGPYNRGPLENGDPRSIVSTVVTARN